MSDRQRKADWLARAARTWDERAPWWDEMSTANAASADRHAELDRWQAGLRLGDQSLLLDAGCGSGQFAIAWALRGCRVTAIDLSSEMLERAERNAGEAGVDIDFRLGSLAPLPLPDASYDAVFCRTVLHLTPEPLAVLREFRRVLRPSGRIYVSVPGALSPIYGNLWRRHLSSEVRPINGMTPWELESLLAEAGWSVIDQWGDWSGQEIQDPSSAGRAAVESDNQRLQQATATTWGFIAQ
jgi:SAM-dependent methyltransferase